MVSSARTDGPANSIPELKPGWAAHLFGIETARLVAADASWDGETWTRGETFVFLYRSRRAKFFVLEDLHSWRIVADEEARTLFAQLPTKLVSQDEAFAPADQQSSPSARDEDDDQRAYKVLRNDGWEFSIWLDHKVVPSGWHEVGISGSKSACLEHIDKHCVFGAPNPGA